MSAKPSVCDAQLFHGLDEDALTLLASKMVKCVQNGVVIYLHGNLGAGKTTFARAFLRGLGYSGKVKSPTYTLIEFYEINTRSVYHLDLYRIHSAKELLNLAWDEDFNTSSIALIEWPEKGKSYLRRADLNCTLTMENSDKRTICLQACTDIGLKLLQALSVQDDRGKVVSPTYFDIKFSV